VPFPTLYKKNEVSFPPLTDTFLSVEMTLVEALFLCRDKCRNDTPFFTVHDESYPIRQK
jgi:hypothetical protein